VATFGEDGKPDGERVLDANDVILASGSRVKSLPGLVPDGERIITSDEATTGATMPKSMIVVGAGAVGVEFASFYHDAGVEVTLLEYLPTVVPRSDLVRANGVLAATSSAMEFFAFGAAGFLVQALTAPIAILIDAVSFVGSALFLGTIRRPEPA